MSYQFQPFNGTDEEYEAMVSIHNVCLPEDPITVAQVKHHDSKRNREHLFNRYVCRHDGQIIGTGSSTLIYWFPTPNQFGVAWSILPAHEEAAGALFLEFLKAQIETTHNPQAYMAVCHEDKPLKIHVLEMDGFKITQRSPRAELDVPSFDVTDVTKYAPLQAKLEAEGIEFVTLTAYKERDENWIATYLDDVFEMEQDMPTTEPLVRLPLEEFAQQFDSPDHDPDAHIFALKAGKIIGISSVWVSPATKDKLYTDFTGVKRPYRRKGIATILKVEIIRFAQAYGAKIIETENEENNPMYALNMQLGFRPLPAELEYKKQV